MIFDAVIYALIALAIVLGFNSGMLRSMATILGYVIAAPVALGVAPALSFFLATRLDMPPAYNGVVLAGLLLALGMIFGALLRRAVSDVIGPQVSIPDRIAGAALGAMRIGLVAVLIVVIFDRIIPANRQPAFLAGSQLRPYLSAAGQAGVKKLPPEVIAYIDRLKRQRGI
ncbi:MAG TPA: CvpA family protein [Xanthobacteraceae bacterium]|nr:CvpA family protein [Xanthobacteraceae bacterium]